MKEKINKELEEIQFSDHMKKIVKYSLNKNRKVDKCIKKSMVLIGMLTMMFGIVVFASHIMQSISINGKELQELDEMKTVKADINSGDVFISYEAMMEQLNLRLLKSELAGDVGAGQITVQTDYTDYVIIRIEKYISKNENEEIYFPIDLEINLILSEKQLSNGWDTEYLGYYEFVDHYISMQGYKVNIIQETSEKGFDAQKVTNKQAIFVADGVRYILKGKVSLEVMKALVDSME